MRRSAAVKRRIPKRGRVQLQNPASLQVVGPKDNGGEEQYQKHIRRLRIWIRMPAAKSAPSELQPFRR